MVVSLQPDAVEAGATVLRDGGNAVDAALALAFVQTVVDPMMCGIAGFGSMHLYLPQAGVHEIVDFHGRVPAAAAPDMWKDRIIGETEDGFGFILEDAILEIWVVISDLKAIILFVKGSIILNEFSFKAEPGPSDNKVSSNSINGGLTLK